MDKFKSVGLAVLLLVSLPAVALAASPHFVSASDSITSKGVLVATFKEAGLGSSVTVNYSLTASATAVYGCVNKGGNHPQASNKESVSGPVSGTGSFTSTKAGSISGSISASPPGPGSLSCPGGMKEVLVSVSYTNVVLTDTTNSISVNLADQSMTFTL